MVILKDNDTINYCGGAKISGGIALFIAAIGSFILGIIDGISNPKACNSKWTYGVK